MTVGAFAVGAVLGLKAGLIGERREVLFIGRGDEDDVPAVPAVSAVGAAFGNEFFAAETARAVAAVTGLDRNGRPIYEHGFFLLWKTLDALDL